MGETHLAVAVPLSRDGKASSHDPQKRLPYQLALSRTASTIASAKPATSVVKSHP